MNASLRAGLAIALVATITALVPLAPAAAQSYPSKPLRIVVPFGAASSTDIFARTLGKVMAPEFGQPIIIENIAGAEGFIGVENAAKSAPDGHTVLLTSVSTQVLNLHLYKKVPYDPIKDFAPITTLASFQLGMDVRGDGPYKSVADFLAAARRTPGKLTYGSGTSTTRLAAEMLQQLANVQLLHVPYKTLAATMTDLVGGQIDVVFVDLPTSRPHIQAGRVRVLAVTGEKRMGALPNIPTLQEEGVAGYLFAGWWGMYAPAGTPAPIVQRLEAMISKGMKSQPVTEFLQNGALDLFLTPTAEFAKFQRAEYERWGKVIKGAGMEPQ